MRTASWSSANSRSGDRPRRAVRRRERAPHDVLLPSGFEQAMAVAWHRRKFLLRGRTRPAWRGLAARAAPVNRVSERNTRFRTKRIFVGASKEIAQIAQGRKLTGMRR